MGYAELIQALDDEAERQMRAFLDGAAATAAGLLDAARAAAERARAAALAEADARRDAALRDARARGAGAAAKEALAEVRGRLEDVRAAALARLRERWSGDVMVRLLDELARELEAEGAAGDEGITIFVDSAWLEPARRRLADAHPALAERARLVPGAAGALRAELGQRLILDDSLVARLSRAWVALEPELARGLLGGQDARA
jgi:hypothetical protein